jgi:DNA-binding SARP family transcriptional activator
MRRPHSALTACPRPVSNGVERWRAIEWFDATSSTAARIVCGPIGSGKTFAVRQFVERSGGRAAYVRIPPRADLDHILAAIASEPSAGTVVLDDLDRADATACGMLAELILGGEIQCTLVLVGRSRRRLRAESLLARGFARACGDDVLAFDSEELQRLAAAYGVDFDDDDIAQLLHDTDGWPIAAEWLVRDAAEARRSLRDAFTHWRGPNGHLLLEFVERDGFEDAAALEAFFDALRTGRPDAAPEASRLEQLGLPIVRTRSGLRAYRILARLAEPAAAGSVPERPTTLTPPIMAVNVFGKFRCEIAGRPVTFSRRRDLQVFAYVALEPEGRTTRDKLLEAFWPGINHAVGAQGLRTTLSRIRRAIADCAPSVDPERYFETSGEVRINVRVVAIDVHRFIDRVEQGRIDDARGSVEGAKHHYRVAQRVYADRVLASEAPDSCLEARAGYFEALYLEVLTRIAELHAATGDFEIAREAVRALLSCNSEEARRKALTCIATEPAATA